MQLMTTESNNSQLAKPMREGKSKLSGRDAIMDIPQYLRADIKRDFLDYKASYLIDELMDIYLVLDYDELVTSIGYSGTVRPGRKVPAGAIRIQYFCKGATGNRANRRSAVYIAPRYPRKDELTQMLTRMREICSGWDFELLSEIGDEEARDFLMNDFRDSRMTTRDLNPKVARTINSALDKLYLRLDAAASTYVKRFRKGRKFGYYDVEPM